MILQCKYLEIIVSALVVLIQTLPNVSSTFGLLMRCERVNSDEGQK